MEQEIEYKGFRISVERDDNCQSPQEWSMDDMFIITEHRNCKIDYDNIKVKDVDNYLFLKNELNKCIPSEKKIIEEKLNDYKDYLKDYYIFPVKAYIHSGVSLSIETKNDSDCRFDTSNIGFCFIHRVQCDFTLQRTVDGYENLSDDEIALKLVENLIESWNQYLSGDVWSVKLEEIIKCKCCNNIEYEFTDSLSDYYGDSYKEGIEQIKIEVDNILKIRENEK